MQILLTILIILVIFNLLLSIGIAGSVTKVIKSMSGESTSSERKKWANIIRERRIMQTQEGNPPSYADNIAMNVVPDSGPRGWDGLPKTDRNWDGLPAIEDD